MIPEKLGSIAPMTFLGMLMIVFVVISKEGPC